MTTTYVAEYEMQAADRNAYYDLIEAARRRRTVRIAALLFLGGPLALGPLVWVRWPADADRTAQFLRLVLAAAALGWCADRVVHAVRVRRWDRAWVLGPCREVLTAEGMESRWPPGQSATVRWSEVESVRRTPEHFYIKAPDRGYWIPCRGFESHETVEAVWASLEDWSAVARSAAADQRPTGERRSIKFAPTRRRVLGALLASAALSLPAAWAIARAIRSWQATHAVGNYWMLPINNARFWFPILLAGSVLQIAFWSRRPRAWAAIAFVSVMTAQAASVLFWANRATTLPFGATREDAIRASGSDITTAVYLGAFTLFGFGSLALGIRDLLKKEFTLVDQGPVRDVRDVFS